MISLFCWRWIISLALHCRVSGPFDMVRGSSLIIVKISSLNCLKRWLWLIVK